MMRVPTICDRRERVRGLVRYYVGLAMTGTKVAVVSADTWTDIASIGSTFEYPLKFMGISFRARL